ncbi:MAG: zinc ribbon domain-containing protein [Clostridiales bacterium]|nr:zinc ribbon domain-containing protein [Clostridiales bacterium]
MPILDEIGKKITTVGKGTVKAVGDFSQTVKLKDQIKAEQNAINSYYTELGRAYYKQNSDNADNPYSEIIDRIRSRFGRITELEHEISALQNEKICANCGAGANMDSLFCPRCGAGFPATADNSDNSPGDACPACGKPLVEDDVFCPGCGLRVDGGGVCPSCGELLNEDDSFCPGCGLRSHEGEEEGDGETNLAEELGETDETEPLAEEDGYFGPVCPACGSPINEEDEFCIECGLRIEAQGG